jgi:pyrroline-5-carboxylate reductase
MLRSPFTKLATAAPIRATAAAAGRSLDWNPRWLSSSSSSSMCNKLAFIGTGKMAQAMIRPLINKGYQPEHKIAIYDVSTSATKAMKKEFGNIEVAQSISDLVTDADFIVCAVKPQNISKSFWQQFPSKLRDDATFISIMAGLPVKEFRPSGISKIVRAMPNTPAQIGEGITVWCCTPNLTSIERDSVKQMLNTFGESVRCFFCFSFFFPSSFSTDCHTGMECA